MNVEHRIISLLASRIGGFDVLFIQRAFHSVPESIFDSFMLWERISLRDVYYWAGDERNRISLYQQQASAIAIRQRRLRRRITGMPCRWLEKRPG